MRIIPTLSPSGYSTFLFLLFLSALSSESEKREREREREKEGEGGRREKREKREKEERGGRRKENGGWSITRISIEAHSSRIFSLPGHPLPPPGLPPPASPVPTPSRSIITQNKSNEIIADERPMKRQWSHSLCGRRPFQWRPMKCRIFFS